MARLAVFSLVEWSFATVRDWAASAGHEVAILVTQPASKSAPGLRYSTVADRDTVVMVVPTVAASDAALSDLAVDLSVVFTFMRVPESIAAIPRYGTVNVHPALLPAYRGANGYRALYEAEPVLGMTLHHLTPEMDGGPILAQSSRPTPDDIEPGNALEALQQAATDVLEAGVPRALEGDPGEPQDPALVTEAPRFSDEETVFDLAVTMHRFQCRMSALVLAGIQPWLEVEGERHPLRAVRRLAGLAGTKPQVVALTPRRAIVAVADGALELEIGTLPF